MQAGVCYKAAVFIVVEEETGCNIAPPARVSLIQAYTSQQFAIALGGQEPEPPCRCPA